MTKLRTIAVIHGSDSDLPQMLPGLEILKKASSGNTPQVEVVKVCCCSVHRNPHCWLDFITSIEKENIDIVIAGAGWANHLTAMTDRWLRNWIGDHRAIVIGVAFDDLKNKKHTHAAILSITEVPDHDVVFHNYYIGIDGFTEACLFAINGRLPEIKRKDPKPSTDRTLQEAIDEACKLVRNP